MHSFRWIGPMAVLMSIGCSVGTEAQPEGVSVVKVEFTTLQDYMIVVPVIINGTGPFKFLFDTGTSRSAVTAKLEAKLGLPTSAMGSTASLTGSLAVSRVHANTVSIGDATVRGLDLTTLPKENGLPSELNGILGEDFLEKFDVLIDNRHQFVTLAAGGTALGDSLKGERLPLTLEGILEGQPTAGRLILRGSVPELGMRDMSFQLDSGTNAVVLFGRTGHPALFSQTSKLDTTLSSIREVRHGVVRVVQLGHGSISDVAAVSLPQQARMDTDALLPTAVFRSVFISHAQRYVIFNPAR
jgi:hypothetical protein